MDKTKLETVEEKLRQIEECEKAFFDTLVEAIINKISYSKSPRGEKQFENDGLEITGKFKKDIKDHFIPFGWKVYIEKGYTENMLTGKIVGSCYFYCWRPLNKLERFIHRKKLL